MRLADIRQNGYTIVEVMIFLAVSGVMFVIAAGFVSGKQSAAEFKQAMNDTHTQIQGVINDVANGQFPDASNFSCSANDSGVPVLAPGATTQGSNQGCVYMGKVVQFDVGGNTSAYNVYTIIGRQYAPNSGGTIPPNSFTKSGGGNYPAEPQVVYDVNNTPPKFDLTDRHILEYGLQVTGITDNGTTLGNGGGDQGGAFGFFGSFANLDSSNNLVSGSQNVTEVDIKTQPSESESTLVGFINADSNGNPHGIVDSSVQDNPSILICFQGGGNNQYGTITIGGQGRRLTTSMQIYNSLPGGC